MLWFSGVIVVPLLGNILSICITIFQQFLLNGFPKFRLQWYLAGAFLEHTKNYIKSATFFGQSNHSNQFPKVIEKMIGLENIFN